MDHNNDIGDVLKKRLEKENISPDKTAWDKINTSLNERDKKKSQTFWKRMGVGALVITLITVTFLWNYNSNSIDSKKTDISNINNENSPEKETNIKEKKITTPQIISKNKEVVVNENEENIVDQNKTSSFDKKDNNNNNTAEAEVSEKHKLTPQRDIVWDDSYKITTTYSHYINELDTTLTANNKEELKKKVLEIKNAFAIKDSIN